MASLHNSEDREALKARLRALRLDSARKWGVMSVDQMFWHLSAGLDMCMGKLDLSQEKSPLPIPMPSWVARFMVLEMPWPKGAPTLKLVLPEKQKQYDLEAERARCLATIDEFAARPLNGTWPHHPVLGDMTGEQYSRLQAKHLNHHLAQFSA
jgi:hypothetical protein